MLEGRETGFGSGPLNIRTVAMWATLVPLIDLGGISMFDILFVAVGCGLTMEGR